MPRKLLSTAAKIERIDARIAKLQEEIETLTQERVDLVAKLRQENLEKIADAIEKRGISVERVITVIEDIEF